MRSLTLCIAFSALTSLVAQETRRAPTTRPPQFTLAAGRHTVRDLVRMVGEARRAPLEYADEVLARATGGDFVLQRELQLDAEEWEDVATALLHGRGLCVTRDDAGRLSVLATAKTSALTAGKPSARTPTELLLRPYRTERATTRFVCKSDPRQLVTSMRPLLATRDEIVTLAVDGDEIVAEGVTSQLVFALRTLLAADGAEVPAPPMPTWPDDMVCAWPGGSMDVAAFLDRMADALHANVLADVGAHAKVSLELGKPNELSPRAWQAAAALQLRELGLVITTVHGPQRLFEVLSLDRPSVSTDMMWRAPVMSVATILDPGLPVQPATVLVPLADVGTQARRIGARRATPGLTIGSCPKGLILSGLTDDLAAIVKQVQGTAPGDGRR